MLISVFLMIDKIEYRELKDFNIYDALEEVQRDSWNMPDRELVPKRLIYATQKSGGVAIGAFKDKELIGYCWGWVGKKEPYGVFIYSHHNAVKKKYQNLGIGYTLKVKQREWGLSHDYEYINWTFDPLQSNNCYLNLHKLGAICNTYHENYWGEMLDDLNRGIDTDRFYCNWILNSNNVKSRLVKEFRSYNDLINDEQYHALAIEEVDSLLTIKTVTLDLATPIIFVQIPSNFRDMIRKDKEKIIEWRKKTREVFKTYFKEDYSVVDFVIDKKNDLLNCYHVLHKNEVLK